MGCNPSKQEGYEAQDSANNVPQDDPKKSASLKAEALKVADDMMAQTQGRRFHECYTRLTLTSYGASCKVLTAYHRITSKKVAVKTIPKSRKQLERQRQKVMLEIGTFRMVEDHPNAVRVLEIFEGAECYYIVMECCEGGELFDHISKKQGCFTERQAAHLLRSLMLFLAHMHSKGIAHLDIKPENIMFDSEGASGVLKVLDFGSSVFVQPNETVRNAFGTVRYASPEMANDVCGQKADIWSTGVVMYILLCGRAPFLKSNDIDTLNLIKNGPKVKFNGERWASISQSAKDCIKTLLEPSPRIRPTAVDVLAMPWLKQQVPETVIVPDTLKHLRTFANQSRIRRLLLGLMADQLVGSGANQLLGQFYTLDKDFSGTLEVSELVKAAQEAIPDLSELEINRMFEALDVDRTGTVDVKEFFAGLIQTIDEEKQTLVAQKSFTMLDKRGAGFVTKEAFMEVLLERAQAGTLKGLAPKHEQEEAALQEQQGGGSCWSEPRWQGRQSGADGGEPQVLLDPALVQELEAEFANLDANGDGVLSFEEFKAILGIQSTPEGLTLAQPQLAAVPSIQEGMESLAQTLRTRTATGNQPWDDHRQGSVPRLARTSQGGDVASTGGAGAGSREALPRTLHGGSSVTAQQRHGTGRANSGGSRVPSVSVDRAQLDLELPYDLETRDLLQLLAPAKRTASQALRTQSHQLIFNHIVAAAGGDGGGRATSAGTDCSGGPSRSPSMRDAHRTTVAALVMRATSIGPSRDASPVTSIPTLRMFDKSPSLRAPSLPPLPPRGLDVAGSLVLTDSGKGKGRAWDSPPLKAVGKSSQRAASRTRSGRDASREGNSTAITTAVEHLSSARWKQATDECDGDGSMGQVSSMVEAAAGPLQQPPRSSALLLQPSNCAGKRASRTASRSPSFSAGAPAAAVVVGGVLDQARLLTGVASSSDGDGPPLADQPSHPNTPTRCGSLA